MIELYRNIEFEQIYARFKDKVARYIHGKIPNEHDAEDLTSDVFVKVFKGLSGFDETKASLSTWIYRITQNVVIDYYRSAKSVYGLPEELCFEGNIEKYRRNNGYFIQLCKAASHKGSESSA